MKSLMIRYVRDLSPLSEGMPPEVVQRTTAHHHRVTLAEVAS